MKIPPDNDDIHPKNGINGLVCKIALGIVCVLSQKRTVVIITIVFMA